MVAQVFPDDDNISYNFVDWAEQGEMVYALAKKILDAKAGPFDRLVALATGGLTVSRALKDYLGIPKISSLHVTFYADIGKTNRMPVITQSIPDNIRGESLLVFDDKNDSGGTVAAVRQYLTMRGAAKVTIATLWTTTFTKSPSDFYAEVTKDWIVFPDEVRETITTLRKKWLAKGVPEAEIEKRLHTIGFQQKQLDLVR